MPRKEELLISIQEIENLKSCIIKCVDYDTMNIADTADEFNMLNNQQAKLKKELIGSVHVTKDGTPRKIEYKEAKGLWMTIMPDKSKIYGKTEEILLDKLMEKYGLSLDKKKTTINAIFEFAISHKALTENPKARTIDKIRDDYNCYISADFQKMDIRKVDKDFLCEYSQTLVKSRKPSRKAYYAYKGVLNLIFEYALEKDIIQANPVLVIKNSIYLKSCDTSRSKSEDKIFSLGEIKMIQEAVEMRMNWKTYNGYYVSGYAMLLAIETGMRCGELCSLRWSDISEDYIHIHTQLLSQKDNTNKCNTYYLADYTKNERGCSQGGRYFPITPAIKSILERVKTAQKHLNISSDYVFSSIDGNWTTTNAYSCALRRLCKSLGFNVTNNHAFRMSLNSNVLIPLGIDAPVRAKLLGHTVEVNLANYTYARIGVDDEIKAKLSMVSPSLT